LVAIPALPANEFGSSGNRTGNRIEIEAVAVKVDRGLEVGGVSEGALPDRLMAEVMPSERECEAVNASERLRRF
jgi:hypothetical protein